MTVEQFNNQVREWATMIRRKAKFRLATYTHSTGRLSESLVQFADALRDGQPIYKVKFGFERYGVFRAYGAGRGYVVVNGVIRKGYRIRSDRDISRNKYGAAAQKLIKQGYNRKQINSAKIITSDQITKVRTPLDWIDGPLLSSRDEIADLAQEYYGDDAMRKILKTLPRMRIVK